MLISKQDERDYLITKGGTVLYQIIDFNREKIVINTENGNQMILKQDQFDKIHQIGFEKNEWGNGFNEPILFDDTYYSDQMKVIFISIHSSSRCNMSCTYCFKTKRDTIEMKLEDSVSFIDNIIECYPHAEKYIVDPTGSGEPLLNLELIISIGEYCKKKSNDINKEVLPMLVTNGTLLDLNTVDRLRNAGILFGVSIDGQRREHDSNRVDYNGLGTYKTILSNIKKIKDRSLLGAAVTLTDSNVNLIRVTKHLIKYFPTISIKPVRSTSGKGGICEQNIKEIKEEYSRLFIFLTKKTLGGDLSYISALLNGDDYFGKFILRVIINQKVQTRCDAGLGRYSLAYDGKIYTCPAAIDIKELEIGNIITGIDKHKQQDIWKVLSDRRKCDGCIAKFVCGGECLVTSYYSLGRIDSFDQVMCELKRHLFVLAVKFKYTVMQNKRIHKIILKGCMEKINRFREDTDLKETISSSGSFYTFTELKRIKDTDFKKYNDIKREGTK